MILIDNVTAPNEHICILILMLYFLISYVSVVQRYINHHKQFRLFVVMIRQYIDDLLRHICHFCLALLSVFEYLRSERLHSNR